MKKQISNNIKFKLIMLNNFYKNACNYCLPKHTQLKTKKCRRIISYDNFSLKKNLQHLEVVSAKNIFVKEITKQF